MKTYIQRITPGGSVLFETTKDGYHFRRIRGEDIFELFESEAGIYVNVTTFRGQIACHEQLYAMDRSGIFWLLNRQWSGEAHRPGMKYKRDLRYPIGTQVRLDQCLRRANPKLLQSQNTESNSSTTASAGSSMESA